MYDYLVDNALRNVWCAPTQDRQAILQPARLTPDGGVVNSVQIDWSQYRLPVSNTAYHIYQIGQISPFLLGLLSWARTWTPFAVAMNRLNLIVDLYVNSGIQLARFQSYFMITRDNNLVVAVQLQSTIDINLDHEPLCLRLYSNAFFQSPRATAGATQNYIQTGGIVPRIKTDILPVQNTVTALRAQPGTVYCFVNGFKVDTINVVTAQPGDVIEYVYDSSVYRVADFALTGLPVFNSTLDSKYKYLLHYNGRGRHTIDYEDDIDVWVIYTLPSGLTQGVFYHHNETDAIRNVTHRDYALPTAYVAGYLSARGNWNSESNVTIRLHIRKAGLERPLIHENNRIFELYKLDDDQIVSAMAGVDATLENWQAATLEAAPYTRIMRACSDRSGNSMFDRRTVEEAYGYNATSRLVGMSPLIPVLESGQLIVSLPYNLQSNVTAWEYNEDGTLLGYYPHASGGVYVCQNSDCALVEVIYGAASQLPDDTYGQASQVIDPRLDYRMYTCDIASVTGKPLLNWTDVTGSSQYAIQDGILTWLIDTTKTYTCVRSNRTMLAYTLYIQPQEGILPITIQQQGILDYVLQLFSMQIPMGQLDVFVNGRSMIQDLDYVMRFPVIMINNVSALSFPQDRQQQITLRWTGFCNSDLSIPLHRDVGWVQYGLLSNNNRYNIRDDDVTRIVVGGGVFPKSNLKFAEDDANILSPLPINGLPYQVQKVIVPMLGVTNEDTWTYFDRALAVDRAVEDYMTLYYPLPAPGVASGPDVIEALYPLFSPFCCKIIYDLVLGIIDETPLQSFYNDDFVREVCQPYEYLLAFDPTQPANTQDPRFVTIRPHNLTVTIALEIYAYNFVNNAIRIYLGNQVLLNNYVSIADLTGSNAITSATSS
ncbi:hypothetical protein HDG34_003255 [Paraburkholderia sp. HC6.4b]|uniref:DUF7193 family protein n=1 Tax=unclassified Paraburkholderia TaxID=2615204 RepID=UPI00160DD5EE|nr:MULTISPECIES: hypothetical protein [unclassified Paraburkholderia]MBB5409314.1 hypothetical protein [Paraburkholderia sp. HC6.4b]MBB5451042.1 hypothetical protein [Paraburkholderia sp. Kb1A]